MTNSISNSDIVIDSRDIISRIEELESEREVLEEAITEANKDPADKVLFHMAQKALAEWDESEDAEELKALQALAEEAEGYSSDWRHGETLINAEYWVEYCEDLVKDIGGMPRDIPSYIEIDWEATAENLKADYTEVDFNGTTFYMRNS